MLNLGYMPVSKSFLTKNINNFEINITRRNNFVESIIGYQNNDIIELPKEIVIQVENDIKNSI